MKVESRAYRLFVPRSDAVWLEIHFRRPSPFTSSFMAAMGLIHRLLSVSSDSTHSPFYACGLCRLPHCGEEKWHLNDVNPIKLAR